MVTKVYDHMVIIGMIYSFKDYNFKVTISMTYSHTLYDHKVSNYFLSNFLTIFFPRILLMLLFFQSIIVIGTKITSTLIMNP